MYGTVRQVEGGQEIRYERDLGHPAEEVWAAITDPERIPAWLGRAEIDLRVGGDYILRWDNSDAVMNGKITRLEPPTLLETDSTSHGMLRWELRPEGDACHLTLTVVIETPEHLTKAAAGWHLHLDLMEKALDGGRVDWSSDWMKDWERIHEGYVELYGEEAASRA
jgi:uncharacterized protein YndB with AHSA1/START domain